MFELPYKYELMNRLNQISLPNSIQVQTMNHLNIIKNILFKSNKCIKI